MKTCTSVQVQDELIGKVGTTERGLFKYELLLDLDKIFRCRAEGNYFINQQFPIDIQKSKEPTNTQVVYF